MPGERAITERSGQDNARPSIVRFQTRLEFRRGRSRPHFTFVQWTIASRFACKRGVAAAGRQAGGGDQGIVGANANGHQLAAVSPLVRPAGFITASDTAKTFSIVPRALRSDTFAPQS